MYRLTLALFVVAVVALSYAQDDECMDHGVQCKWKNAGGAGKPCCATADGEATACTQAINPSGAGGQFYCMLTRCLA